MMLSWMAWTWQTALFFLLIVAALIAMGVWEYKDPGGGPRDGVLGLHTTRGDRLFISLLGSGFIHIFWLGLSDLELWGASIVSVFYAIFVFRKV